MQAAQRPAPDVERYAPLRIAGAKPRSWNASLQKMREKTSFIRQLFRLDQPNSGDCKGGTAWKDGRRCLLAEIRCKIPKLREFSQRVILPGRGRKLIGRHRERAGTGLGRTGIKSLYSPTSSGYVRARNTCLCREQRAAASEVTANEAVDFVTGIAEEVARACDHLSPRHRQVYGWCDFVPRRRSVPFLATGLLRVPRAALLGRVGPARLFRSCRERFKTGDRRRVVWHAVDLNSEGAVRALMATLRPTHLLHLAWITTPSSIGLPRKTDWLEASLALVRAFGEQGGQRVVGVGSATEYQRATSPAARTRPRSARSRHTGVASRHCGWRPRRARSAMVFHRLGSRIRAIWPGRSAPAPDSVADRRLRRRPTDQRDRRTSDPRFHLRTRRCGSAGAVAGKARRDRRFQRRDRAGHVGSAGDRIGGRSLQCARSRAPGCSVEPRRRTVVAGCRHD